MDDDQVSPKSSEMCAEMLELSAIAFWSSMISRPRVAS
jgi:hypothetical protein